eukprot:362750-Pelagomonas_calceolata.AAC.4
MVVPNIVRVGGRLLPLSQTQLLGQVVGAELAQQELQNAVVLLIPHLTHVGVGTQTILKTTTGGYVGTAEDSNRIRRQEKQREEQRKKHEALEHAFKNETIGLVTKEEFIKKRMTLAERRTTYKMPRLPAQQNINKLCHVSWADLSLKQLAMVELNAYCDLPQTACWALHLLFWLQFNYRMEEELKKKQEAEEAALEREKERKRLQKQGAGAKKLSFAMDVSILFGTLAACAVADGIA